MKRYQTVDTSKSWAFKRSPPRQAAQCLPNVCYWLAFIHLVRFLKLGNKNNNIQNHCLNYFPYY